MTGIPASLEALRKNQTNVQVGNGKNLWDYCSTENAATAHSLLAKSLLDSHKCGRGPKVDGEAFQIHDGSPRLLWEYTRLIWKYALHEPTESLMIIPAAVALILAIVLELIFWIFTLGTKRPQLLRKQQVEYACFTHTYNRNKAKGWLGYNPKQNLEENLEQAVRRSLDKDHDGWGEKFKKR